MFDVDNDTYTLYSCGIKNKNVVVAFVGTFMVRNI